MTGADALPADPQCRVFSPDIEIHWFRAGAQPGDPCYCGITTMDAPDDEDDQ